MPNAVRHPRRHPPIPFKTNPFIIFIPLPLTHCPSVCYNRICAHYKWVRFAESMFLRSVSPYQTAPSFYPGQALSITAHGPILPLS
jgi:hypothetical protein